jgi:hypothetical protein
MKKPVRLSQVFLLIFCQSVLLPSSANSILSKCFADPFEKGSCEDKLMRWSYNEEWTTCTPFVFGGCGGTENNFLSQQDCTNGKLSSYNSTTVGATL